MLFFSVASLRYLQFQPFYGGKLHRTTAEVKNPSGDVINRVSGEWNGALEFTYDNVGLTVHCMFTDSYCT